MSMVSVIETERLVLRRPEGKDADSYVDFMLSSRAAFVGGTDKPHRGWIYFAAEIGHWDIHGWGMFAVTMKGDDTCLGMVGPWYPAGWPERELGWLIWPKAEGKGLAYEAALAAQRHAFRDLGWQTAVSYIDPQNTRSIALAKRLGCIADAAAPRVDPNDLVFRHPAPEELS
jgi:RimJ/RimL family protein N-acetyltransferase